MTSYAVLFKTHFWDDFVARQLQRLQDQIGDNQIIVLMDETMRTVDVTLPNTIIRISEADLQRLGLAPVTTHGSVIWYNTDYPHYVAFDQLDAYDYYVCIEYDAVVTMPLDSLINALARDNVDYLGFPIRKHCRDWPWHPMHRDIYGDDMLVYLSCFAAFSHRAMAQLLRRRQEMSQQFSAGQLGFWPNNEAFIPNEIKNAGMTLGNLAGYGDVSAYDWWPPCEEADLANMNGQIFIHPVLNGMRYARSIVHHEPSIFSFFNPASAMHKRLQHIPAKAKAPLLRQEFTRRVTNFVLFRLEKIGLRRKWYANAQTGAARVIQTQSVHNRAG
jgi:hypothetical protein